MLLAVIEYREVTFAQSNMEEVSTINVALIAVFIATKFGTTLLDSLQTFHQICGHYGSHAQFFK